MRYIYCDGGRAQAGYTGHTGDCVVRAIAIATELPYQTVYDAINKVSTGERKGRRKRGISSARTGVYKALTRKYLASLGWTWHPTMHIGSGCKVHLADGELPSGRLIVSVSKHLTCVIDSVIYDTHDPQRSEEFIFSPEGKYIKLSGGRCVYGYWIQD